MRDHDFINHAKQTEIELSKRMGSLIRAKTRSKGFEQFLRTSFNEDLFPFINWLKAFDRINYPLPMQVAFDLIGYFAKSHKNVYGSPVILKVVSLPALEGMFREGRLSAYHLTSSDCVASSSGMVTVTCLLQDTHRWAVSFSTSDTSEISRLKELVGNLPKMPFKKQEALTHPEIGHWPMPWELTSDWMHEVWRRTNLCRQQL